MPLLLNCDLGESFGAWSMGMDEKVMPHIDQANIACGFHAGDPLVMQKTLRMARENGVSVGAHPAYPDLMGFGRRSIHASANEIHALIHYQVAALDGMAASAGLTLEYVKPHGALYNDMMKDHAILRAVLQGVTGYDAALPLVLMATADNSAVCAIAEEFGAQLLFEAFADRAYDARGFLLPRTVPGAVLKDEARIVEQALRLARDGVVLSDDGREVVLAADTLCVHGDNAESVQAVRRIRAELDRLYAGPAS